MFKFITKPIDDILNKITMYRLVLYYLTALFLIAVCLCFTDNLPYNPYFLFYSGIFILSICYATNSFFSKLFKVAPNVESVYITGFILALIITPLQSWGDNLYFSLAFWASFWSM